MTMDTKKFPYRYCFDDVVTEPAVVLPEKIEAVIGAWADFIRTDFETGEVTVPDGKGGWKHFCHILNL